MNDKARQGLSPRTAQHIKAVLRAALNWAIGEGVLTRNAAQLSARGADVDSMAVWT
ncbi:MAG TPA: hypothetical protein VMW62_18870 [Chloroflexota bacterium]|nr:hypothetical protein [Chloroflexota bacterium]